MTISANGRFACVLSAVGLTLAALPATVSASSGEAGRYRFEAFMPRAEDPRLPAELRAHTPRSPLPPELLGTDRAVEIEWVGLEGPGLRGYRLTATIDGGPLSGLATRWMVAPGSGEPSLAAGPRLYRMHLPLPVDGRLSVHAALEAVRDDGSSVLLAVRHATPARRNADPSLSRPAWREILHSTPGRLAVLPSAAALLPASRGIAGSDLRSEGAPAERRAALSADAPCPGRPRGPPTGDC